MKDDLNSHLRIVRVPQDLDDKPTANLDAESAERILEIFVAFNQVGVTVLLATHDQSLIDRYVKRVLRLAQGRLQEPAQAGA